MYPANLPKETRKTMGTYIPVHLSMIEKIGAGPTMMLWLIYMQMKDNENYVLIPTKRFEALLDISRPAVYRRLKTLTEKGLVNVMHGKAGGAKGSKMYRVDVGRLADLFDLSKDEFLSGACNETSHSVARNVTEGVTERDTYKGIEEEKNQERKSSLTETPVIDIEKQEYSTDRARRAAIWDDRLEKFSPRFLETIERFAKSHTTEDLEYRTIRYVTYFVLEEQWQLRKSSAAPTPTVHQYLLYMEEFLEKRWHTWKKMFAGDQMAAKLCDNAGFFRQVGGNRQQMNEAAKLAKVYEALTATAPVPECPEFRVAEFVSFMREMREEKGNEFKFREITRDYVLEAFDKAYPPAAGKLGITEYLSSSVSPTRK